MGKICSKCGENKSLSDFNKPNGYIYSYCKKCNKEVSRNYRRTKNGLIRLIYSNQKTASKKRGYDLPNYSFDSLKDWAFSQKIFHELYSDWLASGYNKYLTPSFDRKDDYKPYTLNNLQIMTWRENNLKGTLDVKRGVNNKRNRAVMGINIESGKIERFSFYTRSWKRNLSKL
jgi:hypothetical protein